MVMTDDDDEADRAALTRLEEIMWDRGYRRDKQGFWVLPGDLKVVAPHPQDDVEDDDD
jgi:hypothetical protein